MIEPIEVRIDPKLGRVECWRGGRLLLMRPYRLEQEPAEIAGDVLRRLDEMGERPVDDNEVGR